MGNLRVLFSLNWSFILKEKKKKTAFDFLLNSELYTFFFSTSFLISFYPYESLGGNIHTYKQYGSIFSFYGWLVNLGGKFRELHSDGEFGKVTVTSFLPTSLVSNKARSKQKLTTVWGNWEHFRAVALQFIPGHVFTRQQSGQYRGLQLRTSWHPLFSNSTHSAVSIDHLCLSFTFFLFPFPVF